jgi:hypothetical protein
MAEDSQKDMGKLSRKRTPPPVGPEAEHLLMWLLQEARFRERRELKDHKTSFCM